jgi:hypothetical protein
MNDNKKILFFGTTMYQERNIHNLIEDFKDEIPMYLNNKKIINTILKIRLKKGEKNYLSNLLNCYQVLIKKKFIQKREIKYLKAWISDIKKLNL